MEEGATMASTTVPRRWNTELDGIRWLPRLIDKARMQHRGELGSYLLGHSPVDHALLTRMGVTTAEFSEIVRQAPDDGAVPRAVAGPVLAAGTSDPQPLAGGIPAGSPEPLISEDWAADRVA